MIEASLRIECCGLIWVLRSKSVEELPSVPNGTQTYAPTSDALMPQYLSVRHRKLGTIILHIPNVHCPYPTA